MKDGFIKVACSTPLSKVADVDFNVSQILSNVDEAEKSGVKLLVFPELCITSYTAGDLFYHESLLNAALDGLKKIVDKSAGKNMLIFVGLPLRTEDRIYNAAAAVYNGSLLGIVPKSYLPNYDEFYEKRQFAPAGDTTFDVTINGETVPFGTKLLFACNQLPEFRVAAEICEDLWVASPPSVGHTSAGATVIVNLSASNETAGKHEYRRQLVSNQSARLSCAYVYANAGPGESTTDLVFAGHDIIAEDGKILRESELFETGLFISEIDCKLLSEERSRLSDNTAHNQNYKTVFFSMPVTPTQLTRDFPRLPFVPSGNITERAELVLKLQAHALAKRLEHISAKCAVLGISGGLDSALALLVTARAKELLPEKQKKDFFILGITMPCFGTTERTLKNAKQLTKQLGATAMKISIRTAVNRHLLDIKQEKSKYDAAYENAQARERTQIVMDIANSKGGIVIGTGDLSELALGWATYNGDHMSMYGVNSSVPKTLVKHLVRYEAERLGGAVKNTLNDILDTPISPELLPSDGKTVTQKTEDKIGPYELHDFFLYYFMRYAFPPAKIYRIAVRTFDGIYDAETILKWLKIFVSRFFTQQFKRSCVPDGVKIGSIALSPRGDWRMPSDAVATVWLKELEEIKL